MLNRASRKSTSFIGIFLLLFTGMTVSAVATNPSFMLNNEKLRFGGGGSGSASYTFQDSFADSGLLEQPHYKSSDGNWYKLTYSNIPLSMALGSGTGGSNWSGATVPSDQDYIGIQSLTGLTVDLANVTMRSPAQSVDYGYGKAITSGSYTLNGSSLDIQNTYELGQSDSFIKITTKITNSSQASINNLMIWVGTRDDWVGGSDGPTKERGNLVNGSFQKITSASDSAAAIRITTGSEGVLFYSTTPNTNTAIDSCCSFVNAFGLNPTSSPIELSGDGSYAISLPAGSIASGQSSSIVWFYAAGSISDLEAVTRAVASASAPAAPSATPGDSIVDLSWTAPTSADPITGYKIRYSLDNGSNWTTSGELSNSLSFQQTALTNGTQYIFQVAALTGNTSPKTLGTWSSSSSPVIPGGATAPTISSISAANKKLTVTFTAPTQTGGFPITDYEYSTDNGSTWYSAGSTASPLVITKLSTDGTTLLSNGTTYQIKLRAKGSFAGVPSGATSATPMATVATAPTISSITTADKKLSVIFTPPTEDGGSTITNYEYSTDGTNYFEFNPAQTTSPLIIEYLSTDGTTALINGTSYPITIKAKNTTGVSAASNSINATPAVPSSPSSGGSSSVAATPTPTPTATTRATPRPTQPLAGPVNTGTRPSQVPAEPTALIGGVPTTTTSRVIDQSKLNILAGALNLEVQVKQDQGTVTRNDSGGTQLEVRKGSSTTITGSGVRPFSTVQVFLPLQGENAKEIARIPTTATGTFNGQAVFATQLKEMPLPIGRQVLQIVSADPSGRQAVVEMTVNIAQPAPAPEQNRDNGELPELPPGSSIATRAGVPVPVTIEAIEQEGQAIVQGDGWNMSIDVPDANGQVTKTDGGALLKFVQNETVFVQGDGFLPGTRADVWLFSDPTLLGTVDIDENGNFSGQIAVDGKFVPTGEHTLQVQGVGTDGYVRAANLGVVVEANPVASSSALSSIWAYALIAVGLGATWWFFIVARRRRKEAKHT